MQTAPTATLSSRQNDGRTTILYISLYTEFGGGEYGLYHLVTGLDRERFRAIVVFNADGPLPKKLRDDGIETITIPFRTVMLKHAIFPSNAAVNLDAATRLKELCVRENVSTVQCSDVLALLMLVPAALAARPRIVYSVIFFYEWTRMALFNALALLFVDRVVFLSKVLETDMLKRTVGLEGKSALTYWGVDAGRFSRRSDRASARRQLGLPDGKRIVGFVGRFDVWKGHLTFLESASVMRQRRGDLLFLMVGGDLTGNHYPNVRRYAERVRRWLADHPMDELVVWGHRDNIPEILAALDVFVCPSDREPFGLVLLEALAADTPVVASESVGALEVVAGDPRVFTARPGDPAGFAEAITRALASGNSTAGHRLPALTGWEECVRSYESMYREVNG